MSDADSVRPDHVEQIEERPDEEVKEPELFKVILHNDDYTTMEFVVEILVTVFRKTIIDATRIMLDVHRKGRGVVGHFTYDIAATKVREVRSLARERGFPLKCTIEPA